MMSLTSGNYEKLDDCYADSGGGGGGVGKKMNVNSASNSNLFAASKGAMTGACSNIITSRNKLKRPRSAFGPFFQSINAYNNFYNPLILTPSPSAASSNNNLASSSTSTPVIANTNTNTPTTTSASSNNKKITQLIQKRDEPPVSGSYTPAKTAAAGSFSDRNVLLIAKKNFKSPAGHASVSALGHSTSKLNTINNKSSINNITSSSSSSSSYNPNNLLNFAHSRSRGNLFMRQSKSINEESPDYETIRALRESVDSLNYKFDENAASTNALSNANLRTSLNDFNQEFHELDKEFSANNWADMQSEDYLKTLNKNVRNKQENIFEYIKTELNYVKILSITQKIYVNVMLNDCKIDQKYLMQMFPDLDKLAELHKHLLDQLIERYKTSKNKFIDSIGDILSKILNEKCDEMVEIYSKVCCMHLAAKSTYKQLSTSNKLFMGFLVECQKNKMLKRYQIPDCLTIITQRLTKYLTLIENMINNSIDDKHDYNLLNVSLDKLKIILNRVNDAVAFYQNSNEFKKLIDNIDSKSFTYSLVKVDKQIEQKKFTSVIPCTNGILIRPKVNEINHQRSTSFSHSNSSSSSQSNANQTNVNNSTQNSSNCSTTANCNSSGNTNQHSVQSSNSFSNANSTHYNASNASNGPSTTTSSSNNLANNVNNTNNNNSNNNNNSSNCNSNASSSNQATFTLPSYIVNTITNEIIEIKFPDESSRNAWLTLVHTHITPYLEETSQAKEESTSHSDNPSTNNNKAAKKAQTQPQQQQQQQAQQPKQQQQVACQLSVPLLTANTHRCNSNISQCSSISSGQGSSISGLSINSKVTTATTESFLSNQIESLNLSDSAINTNAANSLAASPNNTNKFLSAPTNSGDSSEMQLSVDLANILCSFNNIIEQSLFHGSLMRSASSAGETITKNSQDAHVSIPKRAETFNGASCKESQMQAININSDILKSRVYKNSACLNELFDTNNNGNCKPDALPSGGCSAGNNKHHLSEACISHSNTNSELSADSGYQSRLCVDLNHDLDGDNCSCVFFENNSDFGKLKQLNGMISRKSSSLSKNDEAHAKAVAANAMSNPPTNSSNTTSISRVQFENILKIILNDYMRLKSDNDGLKKELDNKNKTIDVLKKAIDEFKNQLDSEKQKLQKKYNEIENKEQIDGSNLNSRYSYSLSNPASTSSSNNSTATSTSSSTYNQLLINSRQYPSNVETNNTNNNNNNTTNTNNNHHSTSTNSGNTNTIHTINNNSNKLSILVKCERNLLNNNNNQSSNANAQTNATIQTVQNGNSQRKDDNTDSANNKPTSKINYNTSSILSL